MTTVTTQTTEVQFVKYWDFETPAILDTEKNEIRVYKEFGKIQVYPKISVGRGIGRGATMNLDTMTVEEKDAVLTNFRELLNNRRAEPLPQGTKYWEDEEAEVIETIDNEIRFFIQSGKVQVYPVLKNGKIGKGATINFDTFDTLERITFLTKVQEVVNHLDTEGVATPPPSLPEKKKPEVPEGLDLSTPWWLSASAPKVKDEPKVKIDYTGQVPAITPTDDITQKFLSIPETDFIIKGLQTIFSTDELDNIYVDSIGGSKKEVTNNLKENYGRTQKNAAGYGKIGYSCKVKGITLRVKERKVELTWSQTVKFIIDNINSLRTQVPQYEISSELEEDELAMYDDGDDDIQTNEEVEKVDWKQELEDSFKEKIDIPDLTVLSDDDLKKQYLKALSPGEEIHRDLKVALHAEVKARKIL